MFTYTLANSDCAASYMIEKDGLNFIWEEDGEEYKLFLDRIGNETVEVGINCITFLDEEDETVNVYLYNLVPFMYDRRRN